VTENIHEPRDPSEADCCRVIGRRKLLENPGAGLRSGMYGVYSLLESRLETKLHEVARKTKSWATSFDILVRFFVKLGINFLGVPSSEREFFICVFNLLGHESVVLAVYD